MKFIIEIDLGSSKMRNPKEISRALMDFASRLHSCVGFFSIDPNLYNTDKVKIGFFELENDQMS